MDINKYFVDTVKLTEDEEGKTSLKIISYVVASDTAQNAYQRFLDGGEFPIGFEGEPADSIIIGVGLAPAE